jgi:hypothetical protein
LHFASRLRFEQLDGVFFISLSVPRNKEEDPFHGSATSDGKSSLKIGAAEQWKTCFGELIGTCFGYFRRSLEGSNPFCTCSGCTLYPGYALSNSIVSLYPFLFRGTKRRIHSSSLAGHVTHDVLELLLDGGGQVVMWRSWQMLLLQILAHPEVRCTTKFLGPPHGH